MLIGFKKALELIFLPKYPFIKSFYIRQSSLPGKFTLVFQHDYDKIIPHAEMEELVRTLYRMSTHGKDTTLGMVLFSKIKEDKN